MALEITDANFAELVEKSDKPVMIDFWAIRNIPTVLFVKGGQVVDKQVGAAPKTAFTAKLDAIL